MSGTTRKSQADMLSCGLVPLQNLDIPKLKVEEEQKQEDWQEAQPQMDQEEQKDQVNSEQDIQDQDHIDSKDNDRDVRARQIKKEQKILQQRKTSVEDKISKIKKEVEKKNKQLKGKPLEIRQDQQEKKEFEELQTRYKKIQNAIEEFKLKNKPQNNSDPMQTNQKMEDYLTDMEKEVNEFSNKFKENAKIEENEEDQQLKLDHILNPPTPFDLEQTLKKLTKGNKEDYEELKNYQKSHNPPHTRSSKSGSETKPQSSLIEGRSPKDSLSESEDDLEKRKSEGNSKDHEETKFGNPDEEDKSGTDSFVLCDDLSSKCSQNSNEGADNKEEEWINETVSEELKITDLNFLNFLIDQYLEQQDPLLKQKNKPETESFKIAHVFMFWKWGSFKSKDENSEEPHFLPEINEKQIKDHIKSLMKIIKKYEMSDCALWNILCDQSKHNIKIDEYLKGKLQECKEDLDKVRNKIVDLATPEKIKKEKEQEILKKVMKVLHGDLNEYNNKLKENIEKDKEKMIKEINDKCSENQIILKKKYQNNIDIIVRIATDFEINFATNNKKLNSEIEENKKNIESITSLIEFNEKREKLNKKIMEINQQIEKLDSKANEKIHQCIYTYKKEEALLEEDLTQIQTKIDILDAETQERSENSVNNQMRETETYKKCTIEFVHTPKLEEEQTSALVIPFDEQLRTSNLPESYRKLAEDAGEKLKNACQQYKNQHFRLRTGLATVFPSGKLKFNSIIAAVGPITSSEVSEELMKKTINSVLDLVIDYNLKSIFIPSFVNNDSEITEEEYITIITRSIQQFIDDNSQDMATRRIVIESPDPAPAFPHSPSDMSSPVLKPVATSLSTGIPASDPREESKSPTVEALEDTQPELPSQEDQDQPEEESDAMKELRERREMTAKYKG
ncbi:unnamed protein product [Moneuplotes crassus]|uniref:Macro domain-containing protein n=1 Tax=Euplotes crassus TaxID=5936 RepID=A0AAD1U8F5_EUPCR|nr:unnamed protein product [Moneuplotes crassus]